MLCWLPYKNYFLLLILVFKCYQQTLKKSFFSIILFDFEIRNYFSFVYLKQHTQNIHNGLRILNWTLYSVYRGWTEIIPLLMLGGCRPCINICLLLLLIFSIKPEYITNCLTQESKSEITKKKKIKNVISSGMNNQIRIIYSVSKFSNIYKDTL